MYTRNDFKNYRKHVTRTMIGAYFMISGPYLKTLSFNVVIF